MASIGELANLSLLYQNDLLLMSGATSGGHNPDLLCMENMDPE
jgi:hypothetical protein